MDIGSVGSGPSPQISVAVQKQALENQEQVAAKLLESVEETTPTKLAGKSGNSLNVVA